MNIAQIENNLNLLMKNLNNETFIYDLLAAYYLPKASLTRLQKGNLNLSKVPGEVSWKKKLFFKEELHKDLHLTITNLKNEIKHSQRFIIVTDYKTLLAVDTLTGDQLDIALTDLPRHYDFFLPWAGMEKATHAAENPADVKAAEKMARLFDEIKKDNPSKSPEFIHNLNIFFSRLLFCYFAEDTNIFEDDQFSHAIQSHTLANGSDTDQYLNRLFWVLNTPKEQRGDIPKYLDAFPYVNGGLFKEEIECPKFTAKSRQLLIDSGDNNDWSAINPDIFGSMFQAVITPEHRGGLGAHYTSVPNIMKVIEPLFLNDLKEAFENAQGNEKKLRELLHRLSKIKLFDPACGSGNFLIIAYKELRRLEMQILKELGGLTFSGIHLNNFYGIELDDFAHEIAKLSLWLAEHQMNVEFFNQFGRTNPTLPLQEAGQIVCGNACRLDWESVCPKNDGNEIYILGNPPYLGGKSQSKEQKQDMSIVFKGVKNYKELDYIASWFMIAANYIQNTPLSKFAFVTTSSINQGAQVGQLWPLILDRNLEITFAYSPFPWTNNAKGNAGVSVSIIGISHPSKHKKTIYSGHHQNRADNINPYLIPGRNIIIWQRLNMLSDLPSMITGNNPYDNNNLRFDTDYKEFIEKKYPEIFILIKKTIGANELLNNIDKWCFWIMEDQVDFANTIPEIKERIEKTRVFREEGGDVARSLIKRPHQFRFTHSAKQSQIIIPLVSSERRDYIPIGYTGNSSIVISSAAAIYDPEPYVFSILSSKIHNCWLRLTGGKLDSRIRYLSALSWNTFPFPRISNQTKDELTQFAFRILEEREKHPEKTLAELYDPDKMPTGLREAHLLNDKAVERCYRSAPFTSDEERLEELFKLYEKLIQEEKEKGTLFQANKIRKKK